MGRESAHILHELQHLQRIVHWVLGSLRLHELGRQLRWQALQALGYASK